MCRNCPPGHDGTEGVDGENFDPEAQPLLPHAPLYQHAPSNENPLGERTLGSPKVPGERGSLHPPKYGNPILKHFDINKLNGVESTALHGLYTLVDCVDRDIPDSAEKSAGLRKLLEAQDCFLRALRNE